MAYQNINKNLLTEIADQVERLITVKANPERFQDDLVTQIESELASLEEFLPSGSGFDSGTQIDTDSLGGEKVVFYTEYHHMNEVGYYDGWTSHQVIVTPTLSCSRFDIDVTGEDRNDILDYIVMEFVHDLKQNVTSKFDDDTGLVAYRLVREDS